MTGSKVTGNVSARGAAGVRICGSQIASPAGSGFGSVEITGSFGPVVVGDGTPACPRNDLSSGADFDANQSVEFDGNRVSGAVRVRWTAGPSIIAANQITLSLVCSDNTPPPTNEGRPNTVLGARTGQCAAL